MRETETDLPLSTLNEAGQSFLVLKPPRNWDGETIDFAGELVRRIAGSKLTGEQS